MAASAGLVALPAWAEAWTEATLPAQSSLFSSSEDEILAAVADAIIPEGNGIGALTVGVDKFLRMLFDKCYEQDIQDNIRKQLNDLDSSALNAFGRSFATCSGEQRQQLLLDLAESANEADRDFFDLVKSETIRGFSTSKQVMVHYLDYKVVPGHYYGCVDVKI